MMKGFGGDAPTQGKKGKKGKKGGRVTPKGGPQAAAPKRPRPGAQFKLPGLN